MKSDEEIDVFKAVIAGDDLSNVELKSWQIELAMDMADTIADTSRRRKVKARLKRLTANINLNCEVEIVNEPTPSATKAAKAKVPARNVVPVQKRAVRSK